MGEKLPHEQSRRSIKQHNENDVGRLEIHSLTVASFLKSVPQSRLKSRTPIRDNKPQPFELEILKTTINNMYPFQLEMTMFLPRKTQSCPNRTRTGHARTEEMLFKWE